MNCDRWHLRLTHLITISDLIYFLQILKYLFLLIEAPINNHSICTKAEKIIQKTASCFLFSNFNSDKLRQVGKVDIELK